MTKPSRLNSDQLKIFNSSIYRKKVKRIVQAIKDHHHILNGKLIKAHPKLSSKATDKQKELYAKTYNNKPDVSTAHYFAQPPEGGSDRGASRSSSRS